MNGGSGRQTGHYRGYRVRVSFYRNVADTVNTITDIERPRTLRNSHFIDVRIRGRLRWVVLCRCSRCFFTATLCMPPGKSTAAYPRLAALGAP